MKLSVKPPPGGKVRLKRETWEEKLEDCRKDSGFYQTWLGKPEMMGLREQSEKFKIQSEKLHM
jgi:hypothetical protein